jgi:hypothetical protein
MVALAAQLWLAERDAINSIAIEEIRNCIVSLQLEIGFRWAMAF